MNGAISTSIEIDPARPANELAVRDHQIGTLNESSLHDELKKRIALPGDNFEQKIDGYIIDLVRGETLIEIQTRNFTAIKHKLSRLVNNHPVRLIYPITYEKWIVRVSEDGQTISKRKSPRRGKMEDLFYELVHIPHLILHPNFSLEVLFVQEEQALINDRKGSWRRGGWSIQDRRLIAIQNSQLFTGPQDYRHLLPSSLPSPFTSKDLVSNLRIKSNLAGKILYSLCAIGILERIGKKGRAYLYQVGKQT